MIHLTESAAKQIQELKKENEAENLPLRLVVEGGGCSGFQYGMGFDEPQEDDVQLTSGGVSLVIDPHSYEHIKGITIDFNDGLHGKGFEFTNPNAKSTCGCGKSFN